MVPWDWDGDWKPEKVEERWGRGQALVGLLGESLHFSCIRFVSSNIGNELLQSNSLPLWPLATLHRPIRRFLSSLSSTPEHSRKEEGFHNGNGNRKGEVRGLACERQQCGVVDRSSAVHKSP